MYELNDKLYNYEDISFKQVKECLNYNNYGRSSYKVNNTIIAYDSETTNKIDNGVKKPFQYAEMVTILNPENGKNISILFRDHLVFADFIKKVAKEVGCFVSHTPKFGNDGKVLRNDYGEIIYDKKNNVYLDVFIENIAFDLAFMLHDFTWYTMFCSKPHQPYYAITDDGIRFKDSLVLSDLSLDSMGKNLTKYKVRKQVGDLDYNLERNSKTPFNKTERGYLINDVLVLAAWVHEKIEDQYDNKLINLPFTKTGEVRNFVSKLAFGNVKLIRELHHEGIDINQITPTTTPKEIKEHDMDSIDAKYGSDYGNEYRKLISTLNINEETYRDLKDAFQGGFTHANYQHVGKLLNNLQSWDFTSSYPAVLLSEKFPMSSFRDIDVPKHFVKVMNQDDNKGYLFKVTFLKLMEKINAPDHYLSVSKAFNADGVIEDNGRIEAADRADFYLTNIDMITIQKNYNWDKIIFSEVRECDMDYLPEPIIASILHFYLNKTKLKGIPGKEKEYMTNKGMLNSVYGMCVMDVVKDYITYDGKHFAKEHIVYGTNLYNKIISKYNNENIEVEKIRRFLYYPWGVWCTAYARRNLWSGILACGQDYVYSDTDSIKVMNSEKHFDYINKYNDNIIKKIEHVLDLYHIGYEFMKPEDVKGEKHQIGVWDKDDGFYSYFKTLGAKRYMVIDKDTNQFKITIAGLSKRFGAEYLIKKANIKSTQKTLKYRDQEGKQHKTVIGNVIKDSDKHIENLFSLFNDELTIPKDYTHKLAHYYVDHYEPFISKDYLGNTQLITQDCGCLLEPVEFTLSISEKFLTFLDDYRDGFMEVPNLKQALE